MRTRLFRNSDLYSINKWLSKRGHSPVKDIDLPELGYIIPGVAAVFIRHCEGNVCIMDSLVSNIYVSKATRNKAMDTLFGIVIANSVNKKIMGFTTDAGALERAKRHGFTTRPHTILALSRE